MKTCILKEVLHFLINISFSSREAEVLSFSSCYKNSMFLQVSIFSFQYVFFVVFSVFAIMSLPLALSLFVYSSETPRDFLRHYMFHRFFETAEVKHV